MCAQSRMVIFWPKSEQFDASFTITIWKIMKIVDVGGLVVTLLGELSMYSEDSTI